MSRLMKPHADLADTLRRLMLAHAAKPAPTPPPSPPRPVLSPSACRPEPAQTKHRAARKSKGFWACDVCSRTVREVTLGISPANADRARCVECARASPANDPRALTNLKEHSETPTGAKPKTAAAASKLRRKAMEACMCRMCALALNPPKTFAEWNEFGLGTIAAEHEASQPRGTWRYECQDGDDCTNPNHNPKAARAFKASEDAGNRGW